MNKTHKSLAAAAIGAIGLLTLMKVAGAEPPAPGRGSLRVMRLAGTPRVGA